MVLLLGTRKITSFEIDYLLDTGKRGTISVDSISPDTRDVSVDQEMSTHEKAQILRDVFHQNSEIKYISIDGSIIPRHFIESELEKLF